MSMVKWFVSNGHPLKPEDIVSVSGYGKFRYDGMREQQKDGAVLPYRNIYNVFSNTRSCISTKIKQDDYFGGEFYEQTITAYTEKAQRQNLITRFSGKKILQNWRMQLKNWSFPVARSAL